MTITRKGSNGEEHFHSPVTSGFDVDDRTDDGESDATTDAPLHPVPSMQAAFEESIDESADEPDGSNSENNAEVRRQTLLESQKYDDTWQARWRQRPTARYHPLLKLASQIVFGLHLLQQQQAKSEGEVVKILQSHVNEVDTFLEKTAEDFELGISDIEERVRHLKLPMEHKGVFETMLDDKQFRTQLLDGNEKIESIINRTARAKDASLYDLREAVKANRELGRYLDTVRYQWPKEKRVISEVFDAMRGNERGWSRYIADLQEKANTLRQNLDRLGALLGEMSRMAATASTRHAGQNRNGSFGSSKSAPNSPGLRPRQFEGAVPPLPQSSVQHTQLYKPLPPLQRDSRTDSKNWGKPQSSHSASRSEQTQVLPQFPVSNATRSTKTPTEPQRPRTAGALSNRRAREADSRADTAALAEFFREGVSRSQQPAHQNPLRSNPPDQSWQTHDYSGRSQSFGNNALRLTSSNGPKPPASRSKSQGAVDILQRAEQARTQTGGAKGRDSTSTRASSDKGDTPQSLTGSPYASGLRVRFAFALKHIRLLRAKKREHGAVLRVEGYAADGATAAVAGRREKG
ncbi:uncharacterized protein LTR77_003219 [Saxophila tyrrhenica]|uniref:Uncharacterized protein n=1 Tax=Saxophila tyrrhenica TaxID=1690608 RepID=A0AAV9PHE0_9PEZI|nr:hypothetical protein LTR77_003219 [Saxophila tyrrhenica]